MDLVGEARKAFESAMAGAQKLADQHSAWKAELATVEGELVSLRDERITALAEGRTVVAGKLDTKIAKLAKRADDLKALMARQRRELESALEGARRNERQISVAVHAAVNAELEAAKLALAELEGPYQAARRRVADAERESMVTVSAAHDRPNEPLHVRAWVEQQLARLLGEAGEPVRNGQSLA